MRVLLTGASGFLGTRVLGKLLGNGFQVYAMTRQNNLYCWPKGVMVCHGDIRKPEACMEFTRGVDVVVHAAGAKRPTDDLWNVNYHGTSNLIHAAVENGVKGFLHVSSIGVIGADPFVKRCYDEDSNCDPESIYEKSKWEAELLLRQADTRNMWVCIVRPTNVFGDRGPQKGLLNLATKLKRGHFAYLGGRSSVCNFVFVEDVAHAIATLCIRPHSKLEIYNISDDCDLSEFVDAMAMELGVAPPSYEPPDFLVACFRSVLREINRVEVFRKHFGVSRLNSIYNRSTFPNARLVCKAGIALPIGWREGVRRTVQWYRSQGEL